MALLLHQENKLLANRDLKLDVTGAAKSWLLAQNDHPEWGARPLRRIIQTHLREPLADLLLKEDIKPGAVIKVRIKNQELLLEAG
jgi:ATP-dependent Clp protease ATP-binding subunit ClpA